MGRATLKTGWALGGLTIAAFAGCSRPQVAPDYALCNSSISTPDQFIAGCGAIIAAGRETPANLAIAYAKRGYAYEKKKQFDRAIADETRAIALNPAYEHAYFRRGADYYFSRRASLAIADLTQAVALDPNDAAAIGDRGNAYDLNGQYDLAIADYTKAIALIPMNPKVYWLRGVAYDQKGLKEKAIEDYRAALQLNPDYQDAKDGLAKLGAKR